MDLWKILLVTMLASGFVVVASFQVGDDISYQDGEYEPESNECSVCYYYFQTGHGPYEILWKLATEIRSRLSLRSLILMMLDPGRLKLAEYVFHDYCQRTCVKKDVQLRRANIETYPCQNENGGIDYE